jgi:hypothetical protein
VGLAEPDWLEEAVAGRTTRRPQTPELLTAEMAATVLDSLAEL